MKTVETLGGATMICIDKTGTITENKMSLAKLYTSGSQKITSADDQLGADEKELVRIAMWASEPIPFDAMEITLHEAYAKITQNDERPDYRMIHEYPLGGKPPMMTHIFGNDQGTRIIAAKGAPEAIIRVSQLTDPEKKQLYEVVDTLSKEGYRLLGVGEANFTGPDFPETQQEFTFIFKGLVAFYDPPKENIQSVLNNFIPGRYCCKNYHRR